MVKITQRKFDTNYRKKLSNKIKMLNCKEDYLKLFKILQKEENFKYTKNNNGIWINLNVLQDKTIEKIRTFLIKTLDLTSSIENFKYEYKPYAEEKLNNTFGPKLSNHEKSLIKRINLSKD